MKTLIVHLPSGDQSFTSDEFQFGYPDKAGCIEVMKIDGTDHIAFFNVAIEVQTSNPVVSDAVAPTEGVVDTSNLDAATVAPPDPAPPTI